MKKLFFSLASVALALSAMAEVLSPQEALDRLGSVASPLSTTSMGQSPHLLKTTSAGNEAAVYLFDRGQGRDGFLVVSADNVAPALLGYSDQGKFTAEDINPEMAWWLDQYAKQIEYVRTSGVSINTTAATPERASISPMVTTRWNQSAPYNDMTPLINGQHPVTGCVATAMAQVLKYHNWPTQGTGTYSYTPQNVGKEVTFDYGATTFDWDNMLNTYDNGATQAQKDAVATLMLACGVSVDMDYGVNESGAQSIYVPAALIEFFNYDAGVVSLERDFYGIDEWNDIIYSQLRDYGPVQISGSNYSGGHSFVCDGYSENNYFHINWGWGGMSDGYFLLTALDPDSQGIGGSAAGYNFNQCAVANVKPADPSNPTAPVPYFLAYEISPQSNTVTLGNQVVINGIVLNGGVASVSGQLGMILTDAEGNEYAATGSSFNNLPIGNGFSQWGLRIPSGLPAGSYTVTPVVVINGQAYPINVAVGAKFPQAVTVSGTTATFVMASEPTLTATKMEFKAPLFIGNEVFLDLTLANSTDVEYAGAVQFVITNSSGTVIATSPQSFVDVPAKGSVDTPYNGKIMVAQGQTLTAGTYPCYLIDKNGNKIAGSDSTVEIRDAVTTSLTASNFTLLGDKNNIDASNITVTATIRCTSGYYIGSIWVAIFNNTTGQNVGIISSPQLIIPAGESQNITFNGSLDNPDPSLEYFACLYRPDTGQFINDRTQNALFHVVDKSGIDSVEDDTATEIRYFNLQGIEVSGESLAPGLYITVTTDKAGNSSTSKAIIR